MFSFISQIFQQSARSATKARTRPQTARRLQCEALEDRMLLSVTGSEFLVNTTKPLKQIEAAVASSPIGRTVVIWTEVKNQSDSDIKGQIYDSLGHKIGGELTIANGLDRQYAPSVAMDGNGNFAVTWTIDWSSTDQDIYAARFNASGVRQGNEFKVAWSYKSEFAPSVAMAANGDFVIAYQFKFNSTDTDIYARQYKANGTFVRQITVTDSTRNETQAVVTAAPDGRFAIAYTTNNDVYLKRYSKDGALTGAHAIATTTLEENNPAVAMDRNGNALVVFQTRTPGSANTNLQSRLVSSTGALGTLYNIAQSTNAENSPSVAVDPTTNRFVTAYQVGTTSTSGVVVAELSTAGAVTYTSTIGTGLSLPAVSIGASKRYMVIAQSNGVRLGDPDGGIVGRLGQLP